eukprot:777817_1
MQSRLDHQLVLTDPDSPGYASFVDSRSTDGSPFHRNIYFFNLTNPAEVLLGAPPRLTEHGPYAFRRDTVHQQPSFSADSTQITATPWTIFSFVAEESVGKLSDRFTSVNAVFQRFAYLARNDTLAKLALYFVYDNRPDVNYTDQDILFSTRPLGEFLFGFLDPDLEYAADTLGIPVPTVFPGLMPNLTADANPEYVQPNTVFTGLSLAAEIQQFAKFSDFKHFMYCPGLPPCVDPVFLYVSEEASRVFGTSGKQFARPVHAEDVLDVLIPILPRVVRLQPNSAAFHQKFRGIDMLRFAFDDEILFSNSSDFYQNGIPKGVVNSERTYQFSRFFSKPHFTDGDPSLSSAVEGMVPDPEADRSSLDVEPISGITMRIHLAFQTNIFLEPVSSTDPLAPDDHFSQMKPVYLPVYYFTEDAEIGASQAKQFRRQVYVARAFAHITPLVAFPLGGVLLASALFVWVRYRRRGRKLAGVEEACRGSYRSCA